MANDPRIIDETPSAEPDVERPTVRPVSAGARAGSSCMMWFMIIGMGIFISMMIIWGISNLDKIVQ